MMRAILNNLTAALSMLKETGLAVVYVTASSKEEGDKIGQELVTGKLAACCNVIPGITSHYVWQGSLSSDQEVLLVMKTRMALVPRIANRVKELHSYSVPEVIALPIAGGLQEYMKWVEDSTLPE
jgi:periplasmic divalent cation tolerance protein